MHRSPLSSPSLKRSTNSVPTTGTIKMTQITYQIFYPLFQNWRERTVEDLLFYLHINIIAHYCNIQCLALLANPKTGIIFEEDQNANVFPRVIRDLPTSDNDPNIRPDDRLRHNNMHQRALRIAVLLIHRPRREALFGNPSRL